MNKQFSLEYIHDIRVPYYSDNEIIITADNFIVIKKDKYHYAIYTILGSLLANVDLRNTNPLVTSNSSVKNIISYDSHRYYISPRKDQIKRRCNCNKCDSMINELSLIKSIAVNYNIIYQSSRKYFYRYPKDIFIAIMFFKLHLNTDVTRIIFEFFVNLII